MRILLTGASGFLGGVFCRELAREHEITGLYRQRPFLAPGVRARQLDLAGALTQGSADAAALALPGVLAPVA